MMGWTKCEVIWNDGDFTPCFLEHYIANIDLLLIPLSLIILLISRNVSQSSRPVLVSPTRLTSPIGELRLRRLESDTILSALAANLQSMPLDGNTGPKSTGEQAAEVINGFHSEETELARNHRKAKWTGGLLGSLLWLGTELGGCYSHGDLKTLVFPVYILSLSLLSRPPIAPVLSVHLLSQIIKLRSYVLRTPAPATSIILPPLVELAYWTMLMSLPYTQLLGGLLSGGTSQGGRGGRGHGAEPPAHLEKSLSAFSRATFSFMLPFLIRHYRSPIQLIDIPSIREDDASAAALASFRADQARHDVRWAKQHLGSERERNLGWNLWRFFMPEIAAQCFWSILSVFFQYLPPLGLRLLLEIVNERESHDSPPNAAYLYIGMMVAGQCACVIFLGQSLYLGRRLCIRVRAIVLAELFTKTLRRRDDATTASRSDPKSATSSDGRINNLASNDAIYVSEICAHVQHLAGCSVAILINISLLYSTLGYASFAGVAVLLILMPLGAFVGRRYSQIQRTFMGATDVRLEMVTEVITYIRLIKFNAWEGRFFEKMMATRNKELAILARRFAIAILLQAIVWGTPVVVTVSAFAVHTVLLHHPLTPDRAFASLILFNMLKAPLDLLQDTSTRLLQAYTSCIRIQAYLDEPETLKYQQLSQPAPGDPDLGFSHAILRHGHSESSFELGPLNLSFPVSRLSIVVGPVGSGKSTLITSLLGETNLVSGKIFMPDDHANRNVCPKDSDTGLTDTVAYCSQTPWLLGASIKENIVFGAAFDRERYVAVVEACALGRDLAAFDLGDETEVGEKGTTCSGGQKARIALARAVYSSAKTVILDDVLAAVDTQTAHHLLDHVFQGPLMAKRTVIMVTHAVSLMSPAAAFMVMLGNGRVVASGPTGLLAAGVGDEARETSTSARDIAREVKEETAGMPSPSTGVNKLASGKGLRREGADKQNAVSVVKARETETASVATSRTEIKPDKGESQASGAVDLSIYTLYWKAMGRSSFWAFLLVALLLSQVLQVATNAWIRVWANADTADCLPRISSPALLREVGSTGRSTQFYLGVYVALSAAYILSIAGRVGINFFGSLRASRRLYECLLQRILGANLRFFDTTPMGRIMNRLSKDILVIDTEAGEIFLWCVNCILSVVSILAIILWSTPEFAIALSVIVALYYLVSTLYVTTSRELKRYDSVTRSPIFVILSEVLVGASTVRSYGDSARFIAKLFRELDQNSRCYWYLWQCNRTLNIYSSCLGSFVTAFAAVFALHSPGMDAAAVGLTLTYALSFTDYVLWIVRLYAATEMIMNSVERVGEYMSLAVEEEEGKAGVKPPAHWPSRSGRVIVSNLYAGYAPHLAPVLRDVSFEIGPREKIGICGRTGSGKSSLALSFLRFLYPISGSIVIDGLNIGDLSLATLRSRLTILPQDAQLFSGTIRDNLDPCSEHDEAEIWDALQRCGLASEAACETPIHGRPDFPPVDVAPGLSADKVTAGVHLHTAVESTRVEQDAGGRVAIRSLDDTVAAGGRNFSQGQRQLLALARGILKLQNSALLIMDESTANLDHATDQTIQNVLKTDLADMQMLIIAHRLSIVCACDKILVLDEGRVVEFGTPWDLIRADGAFRELVKHSGEEDDLTELARRGHEDKIKIM